MMRTKYVHVYVYINIYTPACTCLVLFSGASTLSVQPLALEAGSALRCSDVRWSDPCHALDGGQWRTIAANCTGEWHAVHLPA